MLKSSRNEADTVLVHFYRFIDRMKNPDQEKEVISVVELDQFKTTLNAYKHPLQEVRDSL